MEVVPGFLGRTEQLEMLDRALESALHGRPQVVLITGEAGVGKSRLVQHWLHGLPRRATCQVRADPDETTVEFATAHQILAWSEVRADRRDEAVDGTARGSPRASRTEVGLALLECFADSQHQRSAGVIVVDDLHWADAASLTALAFAARRLRQDKVMVIAAAREGELPPAAAALTRLAQEPTGRHIRVDGLTVEETGELASAVAGRRLDPVTVRALHDATRGNPLWVQSVAERVSAFGITHGSDLPTAPSLSAAVRGQMESCEGDARDFLSALAVLAGEQPVARVARLAGVHDVWSALDGALASGLVSCQGAPPELTVSFTHPVMAPAVEDALPYGRRHTLHRAAAATAVSRSEQLRHLVACAAGPDPELAAEVLAHGRALAERGSLLEASRWIHRAAVLTGSPAERDRLLLESAEAALAGGFPAAAVTALQEGPAPPSGYRDYLLAALAWLQGRQHDARAKAMAAWTSDDDRAKAGAAFVMAQLELVDDNAVAAISWAKHASAAGGAAQREAARAAWGAALVLGNAAEEALHLFGPPAELPEPHKITQEAIRGLALIHLDRPDEARTALRAAATAARRHNQYYMASVTLANFGMLENRCGSWAEAVLYLDQALAYAETLEEHWGRAVIHALSAFVPAMRGELDPALQHLELALSAAPQGGSSGRVYAHVAAVHVAHAAEDSSTVIAHGHWIARQPPASGAWLPGLFQWAGRYAQALVDSGDVRSARELSSRLSANALSRQRLSGLAEARVVEGIVAASSGETGNAEASFSEAVRLYTRCHMPFDAALAQLSAGTALRARGRTHAASTMLRSAHAAFQGLNAAAYTERARRELNACAGVSPERVVGRASPRLQAAARALTPQEAVVAGLVVDGLSNREIASQMLLSVRTVEFHLASIFRKLGVRSRTQLVAQQLRASNDRT